MLKDLVETAYLLADRLKKRREAGSPRRPFLVEPLRTADPRLGKHLVAMVRAGAGVPLVLSMGENAPANFARALRSIFVLQDATRKPAFLVSAWKHARAEDFDRDLAFTATAGTVLFAVLAEGESSGHFKLSATAGPAGGQRLVAIARPEDLCDPTAWVRCVHVNTAAAAIVDTAGGPRTGLCLPSSPAAGPGTAAATRRRQKDIPPSAMWLICDSDDQPPPSEDWGDSEEQFASTPRHAAPLSESEHVKRTAKSQLWVRWFLWLVAGPLIAAIVFPWPFTAQFDVMELPMLLISAAWMAVSSYAGVAVAGHEAASKIRSRRWPRMEKAGEWDWKGGAARGVTLGQMLHGVYPNKKTSPGELWASTWPETAPDGDSRNSRSRWPVRIRSLFRRRRGRGGRGQRRA